ncbi:Cell cycle checkpoint protein RAD17 [Thelohanellus kitauei]|uniref:Cell cycle checkpoint protein RAD17 n=1 Tax=Thelohanellus kitauei TaxID=669202 RepID=A0A0C2N4Y5_THEKT|nr:Cell cycle checkpoint protein RAD17 [Thelohanellus kitauei]
MKRNWSKDIFSDFESIELTEVKQKQKKKSKNVRKQMKISKPQKNVADKMCILLEQTPFYSMNLWSELMQPSKIDQLIINNKKIAEFESLFLSPVTFHISQSVESFKEFIRSGCYANLSDDMSHEEKVLVIDDVPNFYIKNKECFKNLLLGFKKRLTHKIIFIYTSQDTDCIVSHFYSMFFNDATMAADLCLEALKLNAITTSALFKILKTLPALDCERAELNELVKSCRGDARYLLNMLQFVHTRKLNISDFVAYDIPKTRTYEKDLCYDIFHTVGRLFYAKQTGETDEKLLPPHLSSCKQNLIDLNVNEYLKTLTFSNQHFINTIHENCTVFITEIENIMEFYEDSSIAQLLLNTWNDNKSSINILHDDCSHIIARSFAAYNNAYGKKHSFRPIYSSKLFSLDQKTHKHLGLIMEIKKSFLYTTKDYILDYDPFFGNDIIECVVKQHQQQIHGDTDFPQSDLEICKIFQVQSEKDSQSDNDIQEFET